MIYGCCISTTHNIHLIAHFICFCVCVGAREKERKAEGEYDRMGIGHKNRMLTRWFIFRKLSLSMSENNVHETMGLPFQLLFQASRMLSACMGLGNA